jgi:hypothetical protein
MIKPILCIMAMLFLSHSPLALDSTGPDEVKKEETLVPPPGPQTGKPTPAPDPAQAAPAKPKGARLPDLTRQDRPVTAVQAPGEPTFQVDAQPQPPAGAPGTEAKRGVDFLLAPIPVSNATTGLGLTLVTGLIYPLDKSDKDSPPSLTAAGGFYSENKSWGIGLLQRLYLRHDQFRFMAAGAYVNANWDFSGNRDILADLGFSIPLNQKAFLATGEFLVRLAPHVYLGPAFKYLDVDSALREADVPDSELGDAIRNRYDDLIDQLQAKTMSIGFHFAWDTRDNTFYPRAGHLMDATGYFFRDTWGSDFNFDVYQAFYSRYAGFRARNVLGFQALGRFTRGDTPFFALSSMNLRGYAFGEYMDKLMLTTQVEYRRDLWWRLGAVAFAGLGEVSPSWSAFSWDALLPSYGVGIRFRLTKDNPVNLRVDFAFTNDDHAIVMFVGEAF